jgi:hypothetical protein
MKTVHYFFTPVSPWTYLGHDRFVAMARRHGATVVLRPMDLGRVFPVSGGLPLGKRAPQRQAYRLFELARWRDFVGVPLNIHPKFFPAPADLGSKAICAAELAAGTDAARSRRRNAGVRKLQLGFGQGRLGLGHLGGRRLGLGAIDAHVLDAGLGALSAGLAVGEIRLGLAPGRHRPLRFIAGDAALLGQTHQPLGISPGAGHFTAGGLLFGDGHPLGGAGGAEGGARLGAHRLGFAAHLL